MTDDGANINIEDVFIGLRRAWHPPSASIQASFTRLTQSLGAIFGALQSDPDLAELHKEIYQDIPGLTDTVATPASRPQAGQSGAGAVDRRKGFYFCNSLIQLMEDVYLDLRLEEEHRHPDNRGWMNLFRHWSHSDTFRLTWAVAASTYGLRFQNFCSRRLSLSLGVTDLLSVWDEKFSDEKNPLDAALASEFDNVEERLIEMLMSPTVRGVGNPIADRVKQVLVARLLVPSNRTAERLEIGRRSLTPGERADDLLSMNIGIVVVTRKEDFESAALLTLAIRRQLRDQGLGRQVIHDVVCRLGVKKIEVPPDAELSRIGLPTGSRESMQNLFRSVVNEVDLGEARRRQMSAAGDDDPSAIFGTMPTLPYSGVVRPPGATWAHAVGFCFWVLAGTDGISGTEIRAVEDALRAWAGRSVADIETDSIADESKNWYQNAKRPVTALEPEVSTFIRQLSKQPWFRGKYRKRMAIGLKNIARADQEIDDVEKDLIGKIMTELKLSTSEDYWSYLMASSDPDDESNTDD